MRFLCLGMGLLKDFVRQCSRSILEEKKNHPDSNRGEMVENEDLCWGVEGTS